MRLHSIIKGQGFTLALIGAVVLAILLPDPGAEGGILKTEVTTKALVALTFLIQGLSLPTRQILASAAKIKLHAFCQLSNFALAPITMLGLIAIFGGYLHEGIYLGAIYLSVLPATISSAIILTGNAEGDSSAALFSTTLSNAIGVFATPILCSILLRTSGEAEISSLGTLISKLSILVLLPLLIGQLIRRFVRGWATRSKSLFKKTSNGAIVFIVYAAFCNSVENDVWSQVGLDTITSTILFSLLFLGAFSFLVWVISPLAARNHSERIAAFFCGSQKTLAAGVPMASIIFSSMPELNSSVAGLMLLPLMCYHPAQLFLAGFLIPILRKSSEN